MCLFSCLSFMITIPRYWERFVFCIGRCVHLISNILLYVCTFTSITFLSFPLLQLPSPSSLLVTRQQILSKTTRSWLEKSELREFQDQWPLESSVIYLHDQFQASGIFRDEQDWLDTTMTFLLML